MHWIIDVVVVLLVAGYAVRGWRSGLLAGALGLVGTLGGALAGLWAGPRLLAWVNPDWPMLGHVVAVGLVVLVCVIIGDALLGSLGRRLRAHGGPQLIDAALGLVGATLASALVLGLLVSALKPLVPPAWARPLDESVTLGVIERNTPPAAAELAGRVAGLLDAAVPRVFGDRAEPEIPTVEPDGSTARAPGVLAAADSVLRIAASVPQCRGPLAANAGSGWVSAPERVVTNAHVVAGSDAVNVQVGGAGRRLPATVVAFHPDLDLAVLAVPGLDAAPLPRAGRLAAPDNVAVAGFPGGGGYTVTSGRVRGTLQARGEDIYGRPGVTRDIYAVRAEVRQGNSGGPLLTEDGAVAGTVFARSTLDGGTGYALTNEQTNALVDAAASATAPVGTQTCTG